MLVALLGTVGTACSCCSMSWDWSCHIAFFLERIATLLCICYNVLLANVYVFIDICYSCLFSIILCCLAILKRVNGIRRTFCCDCPCYWI
uniref:Uncharacterized protein n=1 Tax=Arundo donax TaxID=35708 RepID=A0A0A9CUP6_ARUDO